jgi:putative endonuclease
MACKRSAVRSRLAPPRFALRASRGAATQEPKERSVVPGVALLGEDGLERTAVARAPMWYVYIIRSINFPEQEYVGATADLKRRIPEHNAGKSTHTAKFKPWELIWYCAFPDKYKALAFEKYLKSHSGRAFAKKRF